MRRRIALVAALLAFLVLFTGCVAGEALMERYGLRNGDFEFLKDDDFRSILIESTRDPRFRFIVTDPMTIREIHQSLSSARGMEEPSRLEPDYVFEFQFADGAVRRYHYVAGLSYQGGGNFYGEDAVYRVADRIDNTLIRNLYSLRKPKFFERVYYDSMVELVRLVEAQHSGTVGVKIHNDMEILKFQLSVDIERFRENLLKEGAYLLAEGQKSDLVLDVKTQGFTTTVYKAVVQLTKGAEVSQPYYIYGRFQGDLGKWETVISDTRPEGF